MNRRSIGTLLLLLAVLAVLAFIWGNSLDSAAESSLKSGRMRELIRPLLELLVGQGNVTEHLVRKLAHFTEFAVLGALLLLLTAAAFRVRLQSVVNCLFFLTLAALTGCGASAKAVTSNGVECYRVDGVCYPAVFGEPQLTGEEITALLDGGDTAEMAATVSTVPDALRRTSQRSPRISNGSNA